MINEYSTPLQKEVYWVVYCSRQQRVRRSFALLLVVSKYLFRSLYLIWPLYLVATANAPKYLSLLGSTAAASGWCFR